MQEDIKKPDSQQSGKENMDKGKSFDATQDELVEFKQKVEEYLNNWKRERADFINYKKEEAERMVNLMKYGKEDIILEILPILDNIYLAEKSIPKHIEEDNWIKGFKMIQKQLEDFLKQKGIEEIETVGKQFNPETMEAIQEEDGDEPGKVKEELQKGYIMDGKVLRPAKVRVTK